MTIPHPSLYWALLLYAGAAAALTAGFRRTLPVLLGAGFVVNTLPVAQRYSQAWPMLPMHLAPVLTCCLLAALLLLQLCARSWLEEGERRVWSLVLIVMAACLLAAQLFPKDFYLPFLRSESLFAHAMLFAGAAGRACFVFSAAWGAVCLSSPTSEERNTCIRLSLLWAACGFIAWTLSMFSGEMWAYLGWGTPVVWHDPSILLMMAVWFIYIALLHLHFSRLWGGRSRAAFAAFGGIFALVLSLLADFGPFRAPW